MLPEGEGGAANEWRNYAQTFLAAIVRQTHQTGETDIAELYRLLTAASPEELQLLVGGTPAQPFLEAGAVRMFGAIRSVTGASVASLAYIQR